MLAMSSSTLDSAVEFERRALLIGVEQDVVDALKAHGLSTFGSYAFSIPYAPGQQDETPLRDLIARVTNGKPHRRTARTFASTVLGEPLTSLSRLEATVRAWC